MTDNEIALFYALTKIYDNYIIPLNTRVKCWKSKIDKDGKNRLMVGITIKQIIGPDSYIVYEIPSEWWDKFRLMELKISPFYSDNHHVEELLKL